MADPLSIVAAVCNELTSTGHTHTPRFEVADEFDFSDFKKQESGYEGVNMNGCGRAALASRAMIINRR